MPHFFCPQIPETRIFVVCVAIFAACNSPRQGMRKQEHYRRALPLFPCWGIRCMLLNLAKRFLRSMTSAKLSMRQTQKIPTSSFCMDGLLPMQAITRRLSSCIARAYRNFLAIPGFTDTGGHRYISIREFDKAIEDLGARRYAHCRNRE